MQLDAPTSPFRARAAAPWLIAVAVGVVAEAAAAAVPGAPAHAAVLLLSGLGTACAVVVGVRLHRPPRRLPWLLLALGDVLLTVSLVDRDAAYSRGAGALAAAHVGSGAGYLLCVVALGLFVRGGGRLDRNTLLDCLVVVLGVGSWVVIELCVPALQVPGRPRAESIAESLYPLYDLALIVATLLLGFTVPRRSASYRTMTAGLAFLLVGDLGYAWLGRRGVTVAPAPLDLPFVVAGTLQAVSALVPSMRRVGQPGDRGVSVEQWTAGRLGLFVPALLLPAALLAEPMPPGGVVVLGVTTTAAPLVLLLRARAAMRSAAELGRSDLLTGLPTREVLVGQVRQLLATAHGDDAPVSVVVVELDDSRQVVRSWGHVVADALVRQTGRRLLDALPAGTVAARLGGNVFAAVLRGDAAEAVAQAERLRRALDAAQDVGGLELATTVSIGLAGETIPADPLRLLQDADAAMNEARRLGGNRVCRFEPRMRAVIRRRAVVEQELRHALERAELFVVYQPVVDLDTGRVIGAEALLRWTHPTLGDVSPVEFVPIAEETGLIESLGDWVLEQAGRCLASWDGAGAVDVGFTMAVNVSTRQLRSDRLAVGVRDLLEITGLAPSRIVLEITESAMHEDQDTFVAVLTRLRGLGVQLSVDDFGTGYSSLSYLRRLPVTSVKLDRSFVEQVAVPPGDAIARAVQGIAAALDLVVIAEGVEHEAQRDALRAIGVAQAQGWLWGRPVLPQDFIAPPVAPQTRSTTTGA